MQDFVRLVVLSDTHNRHEEMGKYLLPLLPTTTTPTSNTTSVDPNNVILIHCGDFADRGNLQHVQSFCHWLSSYKLPSYYKEIVIIKW